MEKIMMGIGPDRGFVKEPCDALRECETCEERPTYIGIGYGSAPYSIFCKKCKRTFHGIGGPFSNAIIWWNAVGRFVRSNLDMNDRQGPPMGARCQGCHEYSPDTDFSKYWSLCPECWENNKDLEPANPHSDGT